jgi:hypothetical protein
MQRRASTYGVVLDTCLTKPVEARLKRQPDDRGAGEPARVHLWRDDDIWRVGPDFSAGLALPTFDAALDLADHWLRLAGLRSILVRRDDGEIEEYGDLRGE